MFEPCYAPRRPLREYIHPLKIRHAVTRENTAAAAHVKDAIYQRRAHNAASSPFHAPHFAATRETVPPWLFPRASLSMRTTAFV